MKSSAADRFPALFKVSSIALLCFQDTSSLVLTSSRLGKNSFFSSKSDISSALISELSEKHELEVNKSLILQALGLNSP